MPRKPRHIAHADRPPIDLVYARVSTDDQTIGMDVQREHLLAAQPDARWFADEGRSGATMDRPELLAALQLLRDGEARSLTVYRLDRLSRSVLDFCTIVEAAVAEGWRLRVQDCPEIDPESPFGEAMLGMLAVFAQLERRLISQRTKDGLARVRAEGTRLGRPPAISDDIRARIREMLDTSSLRQVAARLNEEGVPTAHGAAAWTFNSVRAASLTAA